MPEVNDIYLNTSIMIPGGTIFSRGKYVIKKRDADSNTSRKENLKYNTRNS